MLCCTVFFTKSASTRDDGTPIGYLITNTDSYKPLASFLRFFVEKKIHIKRFIIDCSLEQVQAIKEGYNAGISNQGDHFDAAITFNPQHLFKVFNEQIKSLLKIAPSTNDTNHQSKDGELIFHKNTDSSCNQFKLTEGITTEQVLNNQRIAFDYLTQLKQKKTSKEAHEFLVEIENKFKHYHPEFIEFINKYFSETDQYWLDFNFDNHTEMIENYAYNFNEQLRTEYFQPENKYSTNKIISVLIKNIPQQQHHHHHHHQSHITDRAKPQLRHIDDVDDSKDKELDINESNFANTTNTSNNLRNVSKVKEPNKVSQELALKEIHACLAREKLNRRFHINERKYANNFEPPKPPLNFPHNGIAY